MGSLELSLIVGSILKGDHTFKTYLYYLNKLEKYILHLLIVS